MNPPLVTVGLPFFNEERYLDAAIRSILGQTFRDFELLLVDDGSSDASRKIAERFDDPRIILSSDGRRRHLPARLNEIVRRARGSLIARMDADDVVHPTRLAREVELMYSGGHYDAVGTWAGLVDEYERPFAVSESALAGLTRQTALERGVMVHASMLARRAWLEANPYDESLTRAEDRDLWCRTAETSRFAVVESPLYVVRVTPREGHFLGGYLTSQRQNRALFLRYGPAILGPRRTSALWAASLGKSVVMTVASMTGVAARIVERRGRAPMSDERGLILEALEASRYRP